MTLKERIYDLKNTRKTHLDTAKALALEGKLEDEGYKTALVQVEKLNGQIKALEELLAQEELGGDPGQDPTAKGMKGVAAQGGAQDPAGTRQPQNSVKAFADAARNGFKAAGDMGQEGVDADGGYTVPEDIVTRVETFRESRASLRRLVGVETVTTNKDVLIWG